MSSNVVEGMYHPESRSRSNDEGMVVEARGGAEEEYQEPRFIKQKML